MSTLMSTMRQRRKHDEGFTLIELMVVVMIIAVLLAIAIPTFLGSQNKAKDRSAQSSLRNGLTAAKSIYTDGQDYNKATIAAVVGPPAYVAGALAAAEPALTFQVAASTDPKTVSVATSVSSYAAASKSGSGSCFYIKDDIATGTTYAKSDTVACTGALALAGTGLTYGPSW
jgi:type IV pilus assembly protein PilA